MLTRRLLSTSAMRLGALAVLTAAGIGGGLALDAGAQDVVGAGPAERVRALAALRADAGQRDRASAEAGSASIAPHRRPETTSALTTPRADVPTAGSRDDARPRTVTVRSGQGLWWIADTYLPDTTGPVSISRAVRRLRTANPRLRRDGDWLHVGDRLRLPAR